jgi:hypothetical protein
MDSRTVLQASAKAQEKVIEIKLRRIEWAFFYSLNGEKALVGLAAQLGLSSSEIFKIAEHLLQLGLVEEAPISISTYLSTHGLSDTSAETVDVRTYLAEGTAAQRPVSLDLDWGNSAPLVQAASALKMNLNAVIDFIKESTQKPIAVYTVFLKVPPALMQKNGISHLPMTKESVPILIEDKELQDAITSAIFDKLKCSLPKSVWVS